MHRPLGRIRALGFVLLVAGVAASSATAAPPDAKVRLDGQAELLAPAVVRVTVSYKCAQGVDGVQLEASVSQPDTEAFANTGEFRIDVLCTGKWETLALTLTPPGEPRPFELGAAIGRATIFTAGGGTERRRPVRIAA
jgi:hypothetical protein